MCMKEQVGYLYKGAVTILLSLLVFLSSAYLDGVKEDHVESTAAIAKVGERLSNLEKSLEWVSRKRDRLLFKVYENDDYIIVFSDGENITLKKVKSK